MQIRLFLKRQIKKKVKTIQIQLFFKVQATNGKKLQIFLIFF